MTVLAFLVALGILVTAHEWGHYRVAVACGVKVKTFSIGFGKPLIRWKSKRPHPGQDTEFLISLIPLGGYVAMVDETIEPVEPIDLPRAFDRQPLWARAAIVSAGPIANLILAIVLFTASAWIGQYQTLANLASPATGSVADAAGLTSGDRVIRVGLTQDALEEVATLEELRSWVLQQSRVALFMEVESKTGVKKLLKIDPPNENLFLEMDGNGWQARGFRGAWTRAVLQSLEPESPAHRAGLLPGDEVLQIDGRDVHDASSLREMVLASGISDSPATQVWSIRRLDHGVFKIDVTPDSVEERGAYVGRIGARLGAPPEQVWIQHGFLQGLDIGMQKTRDIVVMTIQMLGKLISGHASLDNLSGPLVMADYAGRSAILGLGAYLTYLGLVSVSLGIFNLLPLPILDGGHLLYYLYEAITGCKPSPYFIGLFQRIGLAFLIILMAFSFFNDMGRLGWLN